MVVRLYRSNNYKIQMVSYPEWIPFDAEYFIYELI